MPKNALTSPIEPHNRGEGFLKFLFRLFYAVCAFFPFVMASVFGIICFFNLLWMNHSVYNIPTVENMLSVRQYHKPVAVVACLGLLLFLAVMYWLAKKHLPQFTPKQRFWAGCGLFLLAFILGAVAILAYGNQVTQFSEYAYSWAAAQGDAKQLERYSHFPSWLMFVGYIKLLISAFGKNYLLLLLLNAVWRAVTVVLIYKIVVMILQRREIGVLAALSYAIMPASALQAFTGAPELISAMFSCAAVLAFLYMFRADNAKKQIVTALLTGILTALAYAFKSPHLPIALAVFLIGGVLYRLLSFVQKKDHVQWKRFAVQTGCFAVGLLLMIFGMQAAAESTFNVRIKTSEFAIYISLPGLDLNGQGQTTVSSYRGIYNTLIESGVSREEADEIMTNKLIDGFKNASLSDLAYWQITKNVWAWQDDLRPAFTFIKALKESAVAEEQPPLYCFITQYLPSIIQVYYVGTMLLGILGCFVALKKYWQNIGVFLVTLYAFGFAFMLIFSEAQSHYKSIVMPYICIVATLGLSWLLDGAFHKLFARHDVGHSAGEHDEKSDKMITGENT